MAKLCLYDNVGQIGINILLNEQEGISNTVQSFYHLARDSLHMEYGNLTEQSKADELLGSGKGCHL